MGADVHLYSFHQPQTRLQQPVTPYNAVSSPSSFSFLRSVSCYTSHFSVLFLYSAFRFTFIIIIIIIPPLFLYPFIPPGSPEPAPSNLLTFFSIWCFLRPICYFRASITWPLVTFSLSSPFGVFSDPSVIFAPP